MQNLWIPNLSSDVSRSDTKAYFVGAGIASLAGAAFLIRDAGVPGDHVTIFEELEVAGGSMDGAGSADAGFVVRGGRMLNAPAYECTWALFNTIPSLTSPGKSVFDETMEFNERFKTDAHARLVDREGASLNVDSMGFFMRDRRDLLKLVLSSEDALGHTRIRDWFSPEFFQTNFWLMWATTFAFQPWHSLVEFRRYLHRFMHEFPRIQTLAGVTRTVYNQYESMILPIERWLEDQGVRFVVSTRVTDLDLVRRDDRWVVHGIRTEHAGTPATTAVRDEDFVFVTNGSMTDASSLGSMTAAPVQRSIAEASSWELWRNLAQGRPDFGNPSAFDSNVAESAWESFTVTVRTTDFFNAMTRFSGNEPGTGALVTFKDSNWLLSIVLAHQPHFIEQPEDVQVFWGYGLNIDRVGNFVPKPMSDCTGEELLTELRGHLRLEPSVFRDATCIPCRMPFITAEFMPRIRSDRPRPVPVSSKNLAFIGQFVEIPDDVVFTVEYSIRSAQMAVYQLFGVEREVPPVSRHDKTLEVQMKALATAFR